MFELIKLKKVWLNIVISYRKMCISMCVCFFLTKEAMKGKLLGTSTNFFLDICEFLYIVTSLLNEWRNNVKGSFFAKRAIKCLIENNGHPAKLRFWLGYITWVHIRRFANTSAVIRINYFWTMGDVSPRLSPLSAKTKWWKYFSHRYILYKKIQGLCW